MIILGSIVKVTARQGSGAPQGVRQEPGVPQSSAVAIVNEATFEFALMNTSKQAQISASIGLVKVKVRTVRSWDIQEG